MPLSGNPLEVVDPALAKLDAGPGDQVCNRAGDENLTGRRRRGDACAGVDRDAADSAVDQLHLAGMDARADVDPQLLEATDDLQRAADRPGRPVERREESVSGTVDLIPGIARCSA